MQDPVVGGFGKDKIALRRALAMSYNVDEEIRVIRNGQAIEAKFPIPPGVVGHQPGWQSGIRYDPAGANALLDRFGYKRGADGYRTLPDGTPLLIRYSSRPDTLGRQQDELVKKSFDAIGVRMEVHKDKFPELLKLEKQCKLMSRDRVLDRRLPRRRQLHAAALRAEHRSRATMRARRFPSTMRSTRKACRRRRDPSATASTGEMARLIEAYAPWRLTISRYRNMLVQPRVQGYRKHPILHSQWQYIDVAPPAR